MKPLKAVVAINIKQFRIRLGITQEELAKRAKLSVRYISKVENDPPDITLHNLDRIAKGLSVHVAELVTESKSRFIMSSSKDGEAVRHTIRMLQAYLESGD